MSWYDVFSRFYDVSRTELYADARQAACEALALAPGQIVLDLPCGTGLRSRAWPQGWAARAW